MRTGPPPSHQRWIESDSALAAQQKVPRLEPTWSSRSTNRLHCRRHRRQRARWRSAPGSWRAEPACWSETIVLTSPQCWSESLSSSAAPVPTTNATGCRKATLTLNPRSGSKFEATTGRRASERPFPAYRPIVRRRASSHRRQDLHDRGTSEPLPAVNCTAQSHLTLPPSGWDLVSSSAIGGPTPPQAGEASHGHEPSSSLAPVDGS